MTFDDVITELATLDGRLSAAGLIETQGRLALQNAIAALKAQKSAARRPARVAALWSFAIPRESPLEFRATAKKEIKNELRVDLYGQFAAPVDGVPNSDHSITVRVWALKESVWFNDELDSPSLRQSIASGLNRRVMLRFRFDYAPPDRNEPWFHLQIGGQQAGKEYFRLPDNFGVPRFHHYPMSLLTACEFVIRHFYPGAYDSVGNEPNWRAALKKSQQAYLKRFFARLEAFDQGDCGASFLAHCWCE